LFRYPSLMHSNRFICSFSKLLATFGGRGNMIAIRPEQSDDIPSVRVLNETAFKGQAGSKDRRGQIFNLDVWLFSRADKWCQD